uniref:NADH dehydrogenase subunit 1 n=1 Tax=Euurobracon yokahamae TaxID=2911681 RepID=UPI002079C3F5|nr:NADH dehydrogenase subunit 1 [Euurobracon yokahamae]UJJ81895.1 NADH dehydrogenase subunit 1 [Euurobracon yokahamae]
MILQIKILILNNMMFLMLTLIMVLISVAFLTLFERKFLGFTHYRKGPNKISFLGFLQPFSDAMKLLTKEFFYPMKSNYYYYFMSPLIMFILIMMIWLIYPFKMNLFNWKLNTLYFLCMLSLSVYGLMLSGWSSNSSFSLLGSIRSIAQSISYEVIFSIALILCLILINSLNIYYLNFLQKYIWLIFMLWPLSMILFISILAEINRTPFDLSEGESELVSGFNTEYSSSFFVLIFLSEYASILFMSYFFNYIFFNMNLFNLIFYLNLIFFIFLIIWIRLTLPRIRYDFLMIFCWTYILPYTLILFIFLILLKKFPIDLILIF